MSITAFKVTHTSSQDFRTDEAVNRSHKTHRSLTGEER